MRRTVCLTLAAALLTLPARAADPVGFWLDNWPHWRGPADNGTAPHGDPPTSANRLIVSSFHTNNSPVFPSHNTMVPSGITTGPSGNPRFEASSVPCTAQILFQGCTRKIGMIAYRA